MLGAKALKLAVFPLLDVAVNAEGAIISKTKGASPFVTVAVTSEVKAGHI